LEVKKLTDDFLLRYEKRRCFDEHLVTFSSLAHGEPYVYKDTYLIFYNSSSEMLWLSHGRHRHTFETKKARILREIVEKETLHITLSYLFFLCSLSSFSIVKLQLSNREKSAKDFGVTQSRLLLFPLPFQLLLLLQIVGLSSLF